MKKLLVFLVLLRIERAARKPDRIKKTLDTRKSPNEFAESREKLKNRETLLWNQNGTPKKVQRATSKTEYRVLSPWIHGKQP